MRTALVLLVLVAVIAACSDQTAEQQGRADYFTFALWSDNTTASALTYYYYVPWTHTFFSELDAPCGYYGFDIEGSVQRYNGTGSPVTDPNPADSDWNTYTQYRADSNGTLLCNGYAVDDVEGRFEYNRDTIIFQGTVLGNFSNPGAIVIPSDPDVRESQGEQFMTGTWVLMSGTDTGAVVDSGYYYFWPYEYVPTFALRSDRITGPDINRVGLGPKSR